MKTLKLPVVRIDTLNEQPSLSKAQKSFNKLIKQIDTKRKLLAAWQKTVSDYHAQYAAEFDPLTQQLNQHKKKMVELLDKAYSEPGLTKTEKKKICNILCHLSSDLITGCGYTDLKEIYNRHSGNDFDSEMEEGQDMMKSMVEDIFGIDLGEEFKVESVEEMMAHLGEKMQAKFAEEEKVRQGRATRRKKSAAAIAREAKLQEEKQNMSQSVREVYRKLAGALHPDLEQDPQERQRKTEMMQRANVLYDNKDLLGLLELQLAIEQIDQERINTLPEERLIYYNKVLAKQYAEIRDEIHATEMSFKLRFNVLPGMRLSPDTAMFSLQYNINNLKINIDEVKNHLVLFQNVKNIKSWLKTIRADP